LSSKETLLNNEKFTRQFLEKEYINQELGFFAVTKDIAHILYQSVDMFDFFVHHLSGYDYSTGRSGEWDLEMLRLMGNMVEGYRKKAYHHPSRVRNGNVLVVMPFHSGASEGKSGEGLSKVRMYMETTIVTVAAVFPNIAVFVASQEDYNWLVFASGLNRFLYDVQVISLLRDPKHLCFAASVVSKEKLLDGSYDASFEWIYYTEADQIPHLRDVDRLLELAMNANSVVIPHRGEADWHPQDVSRHSIKPPKTVRKRESQVLEKEVHRVDDIMSTSCCFNRNCTDITPDTFSPFNHSSVKLFRQHESFAHITGTGNVFKRRYRTCKLSHRRHSCIEDY
jgi:hypothetical protein